MEKLRTYFLTAPAWQLFLLILGPAFALSFYVIEVLGQVPEDTTGNPFSEDPANPGIYLILVAAGLNNGILIFWVYALGTRLFERAQALFTVNPLSLQLFRFHFGFILLFCGLLVLGGVRMYIQPIELTGFGEGVLAVMYFYAIFAFYYNYYFTAHLLASVESQRRGGLFQSLGYFLMFWFYIIGIWVLQPRAQQALAQTQALATPETEETDEPDRDQY